MSARVICKDFESHQIATKQTGKSTERAEQILVTRSNFDAILLREGLSSVTRKVLQDCPLELTLLLVLFSEVGLDPVDFHDLAAKIPSRR
jgi:hypothetical protein